MDDLSSRNAPPALAGDGAHAEGRQGGITAVCTAVMRGRCPMPGRTYGHIGRSYA
jgi:hypothetical protein